LALPLVALVAFLLAAPALSAAEAPKDVKQLVTVAFAGYDRVMKDVAMVGKLAGDAEMAKQIESQLALVLGEDVLKSLDKSKPWGVSVSTNAEGTEFYVQGFLPTKNLKQLLDLAKNMGNVGVEEKDGVFEITGPGQGIFAKQQGDWGVFATTKESLATIPADPATLLGELTKTYTIAIQLHVANVPAQLKEQGMMLLNMGMQMGMVRQAGESDEQFALRQKVSKQAIDQLRKMADELNTLVLGIGFTESPAVGFFQYDITAKEGTTLAKRIEEQLKVKSRFANLVAKDAPIQFYAAGTMAPEEIEQVKGSIAPMRSQVLGEIDKQGLPEEQAKTAKQIAGTLFDVLNKTIESGKMDMAGMAKLDPKTATFVLGGQIADGAKLDEVVKQLVKQIQADEPEAGKFIKLDAEKHGDVAFHTASVPLELLDAQAKAKLGPVVGDNLTLVLGVSNTAVYLAGGRDAAAALKTAIDAVAKGGEKEGPPADVAVSVGSILRFAVAVADENEKPQIEKVLKFLEGTQGKDSLRVRVRAIPGGQQVRFEIEEGILKLLGSIPQMHAQ
jgi:hypothetical protein